MPENISGENFSVEYSSAAFFEIILKMLQNAALKIYERNVSSASIRRIYTVNFLVNFELG